MTKFCNVLYFKHIIENSLDSFFRENEECFKLDRTQGFVVFSGSYTKSALKKNLRAKMVEEITKLINPYDPTERQFYFMVGSCSPSNNVLRQYIDKNKYFPEIVQKYIDSGVIKYFLRVDGIKIDLSTFNSVFEDIFNEFFSRKNFKKYFPKNVKNLFFVKDSRLDCYLIYRIIKKHFGRINVCNMREENKNKLKSNLYSVNNRIDDYVTGIKKILEREELKIKVIEIEQYLDNCIEKEV